MSVFTGDWYPWYAERALTSEAIDRLTLAEEGAYRRALDKAWIKGSLPADPAEAAKVIGKGCSKKIAERVLSIDFFKPMKGNRKRVIHTVLERVRAEQEEKHKKRVETGKRNRAAKPNEINAQSSNAQATKEQCRTDKEEDKEYKNKKEEIRGGAAPPPTPAPDLDSIPNHPAVLLYEEKFHVKVSPAFAREIGETVGTDLGGWMVVLKDKIGYADGPPAERRKVSRWILNAYRERKNENGTTKPGKLQRSDTAAQRIADQAERISQYPTEAELAGTDNLP
jgi:uncharacterized protein YdaU (DUF1376 family)